MVCLHWLRPIKMACVELCGGIHTAQRQRPMQISMEFVHGIGLGVGQCE